MRVENKVKDCEIVSMEKKLIDYNSHPHQL